MSTIQSRLSSILSSHEAARRSQGVRKSARVSKLADQRAEGDRGIAELAQSRDAARSQLRADERARHAEAARLARRMQSIREAIDATDDPDRILRLELLFGDVESARDRYMHATWQRQATAEDWAPGGRFSSYARRYELGFLAYDWEDIRQDAAEILTAEHAEKLAEGLPTLAYDEPTATGSRTLPHTIGEGYAAIRRAYRRGLGFYGYSQRGRVVERDTSARGYSVAESDTVGYLRMRGADEAAVRAALLADDSIELDVDAETLELVDRRRAALVTLARRFPLSADGRMLALAQLLVEGYTIDELLGAKEMPSREDTLANWARELGALVA